MPIVSKTNLQVRHMAALHLADYKVSTADSGSATTIVDADLATAAADDDKYNGWEIYVHTGTNNGKSRKVTDFAGATGTFTFATMTTANDSTTQFELHRTADGWPTVSEYNQAINMAIDRVARLALVDQIDRSIALERDRRYYDIPADYVYISRLLVDREIETGDRLESFNYDTDQAFIESGPNERIAQGFKLTGTGEGLWSDGVYVWLRKVGSPTDNVRLEIHTDNSGEPSTTLLHDPSGTGGIGAQSAAVDSSTVKSQYHWVFFSFAQPVFITDNTQFYLVLRSTAADAGATPSSTNYLQLGVDTDNLYTEGKMYTGTDAVTPVWTAVAGSDIIFRIRPLYMDEWELQRSQWDVVRSGTRQLRINVIPTDGASLRIIGQRYAKEPSTDGSTVDVDPDRLAIIAAAMLAKSLPRQSSDGRQVDAQLLMQEAAIAENKPWPQPIRNARHVEPQ